eukprot:1852587-Rhodomonas_salina.2
MELPGATERNQLHVGLSPEHVQHVRVSVCVSVTVSLCVCVRARASERESEVSETERESMSRSGRSPYAPYAISGTNLAYVAIGLRYVVY